MPPLPQADTEKYCSFPPTGLNKCGGGIWNIQLVYISAALNQSHDTARRPNRRLMRGRPDRASRRGQQVKIPVELATTNKRNTLQDQIADERVFQCVDCAIRLLIVRSVPIPKTSGVYSDFPRCPSTNTRFLSNFLHTQHAYRSVWRSSNTSQTHLNTFLYTFKHI